MEVGNDTGIQPDYLRKKGNKKRQIPAMGNWRTKNSHYYECTAYFSNLDPDSGATLGVAGAIITITIQN